MGPRALALVLSLVLAAPLAAAQQAGGTPVIGFLVPAEGRSSFADAFAQGLRDLGYQDGRNIRIEYRHARGSPERTSVLLAELVGLKVDVRTS